ncbi:MAG: M57 family metalloprotease [Bdellovibrionota bacterium]
MKFILCLLLTTPAWGYKLTQDFVNGFYWQRLPINITVVESDPTLKSKLEFLSRSAVQDWESSSGLNLWDTTSAGTSNIIRWSKNFAAETNMDPASVLAVAIRYTNGPYFAKTEIIINGNHIYNQQNNYLLTTITHELGHTMGIDHSDFGDAVMAPSLQLNSSGVRQDDVRAVDDAVSQTVHRQETGYVSPLAYSSEEESSSPLSCGTVATTTTASPLNGLLSLGAGILIGFVRRIRKWLKDLF